MTLGKSPLCRVSREDTRQRGWFTECQKNTRQRGGLPSVFFTLGKEIKSFFLERRRRKKIKKNFAECPNLGHLAKKNLFSEREGEEKK